MYQVDGNAQCATFHPLATIHPITILPTELLALIMAEVIIPGSPNSLGHLPMHRYTYHHTALPLSQVSKHWRNTAQSTPMLWTRLDINLGGMKCADPWLAFLRMHLKHSGILPLRLLLTWVSAECHSIVDALAAAGVWRDLALRAGAIRFDVWYAVQLPASLRQALLSEPLPVLEELRFAWQPLQRMSSLMALPLAPRLRTLDWLEFGRPLEWPGEGDGATYPELREAHLRTDIGDATQISEVFDRMPGLETLSMHTFDLRSQATPAPLLEHATPQELQWIATLGIDLSVAQAIRLPALRTAALDLPSTNHGMGFALIRALFATGFPNLHVLEVSFPLSVPFAEILRSLADLQALTLYGDPGYVSTFRYRARAHGAEDGAEAFFARMARKPWVCPRLERLDIKNYSIGHATPDEEALLALAYARSADKAAAGELEGRTLRRMVMIEPPTSTISRSADAIYDLNMKLACILVDNSP